ncbi:CDP-glycerol glycerophosphotransferase family protein [Bacillus cereus]|uniref:CDP-glycerol glycerophosphotransferase family protein n=1 Tax=Bacillus cereus TaxID=1396 RepID=UPI000D984F1A|nr:CDP-glycerol glycerophosphotransferase family protein [Bacillus cereus]MDA2015896.1 CDP-glycerol glycerophosphotransferase family protein [Bacillus cereus]PYD98383.1 CDP-glycerol glycerophosphotransferase family protein [Bacillus cereus]HDR4408566.1 CDP-glycerol glycerophosphotransferase family protein [Bacillus cereus]
MSFIRKIKNHRIVKRICKVVFLFCSHLPAKKKLIVFESYSGKQYSCNPRAMYEYMLQNNLDFQMVWSVNKNHIEQFDKGNIPYVKRFSLRWFILLARAQYWVTNSRMPIWLPKPKHTTYVQTWHGTPLKKLAGDMKEVHMPGTTTERYKDNFHREAQNWDYLLSPNGYSTEIFKRAFQFQRNVVEAGYPRNDFLYVNNNLKAIDALKKRNGLPIDKKIILYAPTWRDDQFYNKGRYKLDLQLDLQLLQKRLDSDYIILLRMHYLVAEQFDLEPYKGFVYDFSKHVDINELYLLSDLLITDYSSVFFDFANLKRPIIFYTYDIDSYRDKLRGFYFDLETEAPGPVVMNTEEVLEETLKFEMLGLSAFAEKYNTFYNNYCYLEDGFASKRVVEKIFFGEAQ